MSETFDDRPAALVTGAGSGMGLATARRFVAEGWTVLGLDRDREALTNAAAEVADGSFVAVPVDVTDRLALDDEVGVALGDRTLLAAVNAAGIYPPTTLADFTEESYRRIFDVNVLGTLNVCAVAAPHLKTAGGGAIVNFASVDALAVSPGQLIYSATKAAVLAITRSLAVELAPDGIAVNAIAPGWVATPGTAANDRMADVTAGIPLGRVAQPSEIAHWVFQLATGPYVTGETLVVSGGSLIR